MAQIPVDQPPSLWRCLLVSWAFWLSLVAALVASPALFWSIPAVGVILAILGLAFWFTHRRSFLIALGAGLIAGSVPYALAALLTLLNVTWW